MPQHPAWLAETSTRTITPHHIPVFNTTQWSPMETIHLLETLNDWDYLVSSRSHVLRESHRTWIDEKGREYFIVTHQKIFYVESMTKFRRIAQCLVGDIIVARWRLSRIVTIVTSFNWGTTDGRLRTPISWCEKDSGKECHCN